MREFFMVVLVVWVIVVEARFWIYAIWIKQLQKKREDSGDAHK